MPPEQYQRRFPPHPGRWALVTRQTTASTAGSREGIAMSFDSAAPDHTGDVEVDAAVIEGAVVERMMLQPQS